MLAANRSLLGLNVPSKGIRETSPGKVTKPRIKRKRPCLQIIGEPLRGFEQRVLNDVRGINASPQTLVHADLYHSLETRAVPHE